MTSTTSAPTSGEQSNVERAESGLDVDWLLHKKDPQSHLRQTKSASATPSNIAAQSRSVAGNDAGQTQVRSKRVAAPSDLDDSIDPLYVPASKPSAQANGVASAFVPAINESKTAPPVVSRIQPSPVSPRQLNTPTPNAKSATAEEGKHSRLSLKKDGRRSSWLSSISSKLSSSDKSSRSNSVSSTVNTRKSPMNSPNVERSDPIDAITAANQEIGYEEKPVHVGPRRPSVLVAAGTETKVDHHPSFLSSALRRLSSGNTATLGKAAGSTSGATPRRILNLDPNRQRTKIADLDQNKLKRVAFKVDVEIAGVAAQADEHEESRPVPSNAAPAAPSKASSTSSKDLKLAKYKDRSEGAALKKTTSKEAKESNDDPGQAVSPPIIEANEDVKKEQVSQAIKIEVSEPSEAADDAEDADDIDDPNQDPDSSKDANVASTTRKKEKKKRSEAERKDRKEKKRRQAEANGLVPLELTMEGDDSDSSHVTLPGASTPKKGQPTTDPMRIYKRCCQLRETPALAIVKEQIAKPSATWAEAPGTVASIDISGTELALADVQTLGDWLAVVPVRRLILEDCNLSDEAVRIILSGLSSCKSQEQARANRKLPKGHSGKSGTEQMSVIEKLSLKNNPAISAIGWKHIALFIHLCRSLRGIDLSNIPFPASARGDLSRTSTINSSLQTSQASINRPADLSTLFTRAITERFGDQLEELIVSGCGLTSTATSEIVDSAIKCRIKRLGLANNNLDLDACNHVVRYVESGVCEGLDLGGNDLNGAGHLITQTLDETNPLFAMSLADCNLSCDDLRSILQHLSLLRNFKFIDLSRNRQLFADSKDVVSLLRRRLPQMKELKRIHLSDVDMTPSQLIALAEIFPDCPALAHVSVLDNQKIIDCMNAKHGEAQEEACAVFLSLMTAVRASKTLVAVEIEVPGQDSSEVIKALSSQVVAYSLRNLERTTLNEVGVEVEKAPFDKNAPEVLLHLVGHMEGYPDDSIDNDEPAPDDDYMMATNGIVKALGVCMSSKDRSRIHSRNISPSASGTTTPRSSHISTTGARKPKNVSLGLVESARKIRLRLRPAMVREDQAGNHDAYRRLWMIDQTLERTIKRFEDEYPESRPPDSPSLLSNTSSNVEPLPSDLSRLLSAEEADDQRIATEADPDPFSLKLARTDSNTSLAVRALTQEEGRMHRFGQSMRREVLKPTGFDDFLHDTSIDDDPESGAFAALRRRLEGFTGNEIRSEVEQRGVNEVVRELGLDLQQLSMLEKEDPEAFALLKDSQLAAQLNAGILDNDEYARRMHERPATINGAVTNHQA